MLVAMKRLVCFVFVFILAITTAVAEQEDYNWLEQDCPFEIRNGIKFGMTIEEVQAVEGVKLVESTGFLVDPKTNDIVFDNVTVYEVPNPISLGGIDEYIATYTFIYNKLYKIEYLFDYPEAFNINDLPHENYKTIKEWQSWIENVSTITESMVSKYGEYSADESTTKDIKYIWQIIYDTSLIGVDITVAAEYNPYMKSSHGTSGCLWRNSITYVPHNYQDDIDEYNAQQGLLKDTADNL